MAIDRNFDLIDRYLLGGTPSKASVVDRLLEHPSDVGGARPFYEGMRLLRARTPDLTLIALRMVLSGKHADDSGVVHVRSLVERARRGDAAAADEYAAFFDEPTH
ncbi:MAG: hypothetical protein JO199_12280 [Candidatus Eremiobacteraeota bacterium]|nr:hypothetical protein [Candidatus Eremiobacteraeota bacterium]